MSKYVEIKSMLKGVPTPKPVTLAASVRIPVALLASITAMALRANVSRNEMFTKLLEAAVDDTYASFHESGDMDVLSEIQAHASEITSEWMDELDEHDYHTDQEEQE